MNSSLLAGLGVGAGIVLASGITASLLFPPPPAMAPQPAPPESVSALPEPDQPPEAALPEPQPEPVPVPEAPAPDEPLAEDAPPPPAGPPDPVPTEHGDADGEDPTAPAIRQTEVRVPEPPEPRADPDGDAAPLSPPAQDQASMARLPAAVRPPSQDERALALPQVAPPQAPLPDTHDTPAASPEDRAERGPADIAQQEGQTMPGLRVSGLPQIGAPGDMPTTSGEVPDANALRVTALERNALYDGSSGTGPRMALVLGDPGLPTPMRVALAALEIPFTVALNPFDSSAAQGAEIYRAAGKEVLILATSLPGGATASDLDVTFSAYFEALPQAVGVIDLPDNGFSRNTSMLNDILPLLAQDGHGLVTFAGGLAQAGRVAAAAGIAHAEVFRVLDRGDESPFTIRRFLDRAMFQASQMGEVIVFGDASNDPTLEALDMWLGDGRADQIALVPISAILMRRD